MPAYPWMIQNQLRTSKTSEKLAAMKKLGVPYSTEEISGAKDALKAQAEKIVADLKTQQIEVPADREIVALIAYLQRLGTDIGKSQVANAAEVKP
jgi:cytochrome c oxidase cbb3-type subunit I/II